MAIYKDVESLEVTFFNNKNGTKNYTDGILDVLEMLDKIPEANVKEIETTCWVWDPNGMDWNIGAWVCGNCGCKNNNLPNNPDIPPHMFAGARFCPQCGLKIVGYEFKQEE